MTKNKFSVIMSIYKSDVPEYVRIAFDSLVGQTRLPDEIVVVGDGPVPEALEQEVKHLQTEIESRRLPVAVTYLPQEENRGLGGALAIAVEAARNPFLARMDSDDICSPDRFEKQMRCFEEDSQLSLVGGMITEFVDKPENIVTERILPLEDEEIKKFMRSRCGVNHVTVIFKKEDLLRAGNYRSDYRQEDYYLWARMMKVGCKFRNIPDVVVNVRSGRDQFARRSGWSYYLDHCAIFKYMYKEHLISLPRLLWNFVVRGTIQFLMPNWLRTWTYQHLLRRR